MVDFVYKIAFLFAHVFLECSQVQKYYIIINANGYIILDAFPEFMYLRYYASFDVYYPAYDREFFLAKVIGEFLTVGQEIGRAHV